MAVVALVAVLAAWGAPRSGETRVSAGERSSPPYIPAAAGWLQSVNYFRAVAGLPPVADDPSLDPGALNHSCYMLLNTISHDEDPTKPGYTVSGDQAGNNGNVAVSSVINTSERSFVELWMTGPYHAIGVLRPGLRSVGFGKCDLANTAQWHSGATLDVLDGLVSTAPPTQPILFPGDGSTTSLNRFVVESPNPLEACQWTGGAGLPVIAMLPESTTGATGSITGPNGPLQTCVVSPANTTGVASQILAGDNAVVVIPREPLVDGTYRVSVHTNARDVQWSFTVDQAAANGAAQPPVLTGGASPVGGATSLQPLAPARIVDTRSGLGAAPFAAGMQQRIQVTGVGGVPAGATAVVANITATEGAADGFVTLWNCSGARPSASTLNYVAGQNVPNSSSIPLDPGGGVCAYTYTATQLIVDVTGYYAAAATGNYNAISPTRVMDTRINLGPSGRMGAGATVELQLTGRAGVPVGATAVALNVTADNPGALGVVTVYPCDGGRPNASNLNPAVGEVHANLVLAKVSARGTVCIYSMQSTDLVVDVSGYFATNGTRFYATAPFRFTDTREGGTPALNAGLGGAKLSAGHVLEIPMAGMRGIAANAKAVSANITAVDGSGPGWVAAYPCSGGTPSVSNVNYDQGSPVANAAELTLSATGSLCLFSYTDVHVIVDVNGWWSWPATGTTSHG